MSVTELKVAALGNAKTIVRNTEHHKCMRCPKTFFPPLYTCTASKVRYRSGTEVETLPVADEEMMLLYSNLMDFKLSDLARIRLRCRRFF